MSGYRALGGVSQSRWSGLVPRVTEAHASLLVGSLGPGLWSRSWYRRPQSYCCPGACVCLLAMEGGPMVLLGACGLGLVLVHWCAEPDMRPSMARPGSQGVSLTGEAAQGRELRPWKGLHLGIRSRRKN